MRVSTYYYVLAIIFLAIGIYMAYGYGRDTQAVVDSQVRSHGDSASVQMLDACNDRNLGLGYKLWNLKHPGWQKKKIVKTRPAHK